MDKIVDKTSSSNARGFPMARPPRSFHLQPINGGLRGRLSVPADVQGTLGKKVFYTSVFRVPENEAAKLAWPEVQKFEAMIEGARTGTFVQAVEMEADAALRPLVPSFQIRGIRNADTETTFKKMIAEWARKKRIDNPLTIAQRHTHFE